MRSTKKVSRKLKPLLWLLLPVVALLDWLFCDSKDGVKGIEIIAVSTMGAVMILAPIFWELLIVG